MGTDPRRKSAFIEPISWAKIVESYIIWAVPVLVKLRWYYVEYTYEGKQ